jgi:hypothetical protein
MRESRILIRSNNYTSPTAWLQATFGILNTEITDGRHTDLGLPRPMRSPTRFTHTLRGSACRRIGRMGLGSTSYVAHSARCLPGLLYHSEDGGSTILRNDGEHLAGYRVSLLHRHRCQNLKPNIPTQGLMFFVIPTYLHVSARKGRVTNTPRTHTHAMSSPNLGYEPDTCLGRITKTMKDFTALPPAQLPRQNSVRLSYFTYPTHTSPSF